MEIKRNKSTKVIVVAIAILLCLALAVGITGAWYQAQRRATGTVKMDKGIVIDYTGFGKTPNEGTWLRETTISFKLFEDADVQPGEKISLNDAGIKANASSVDFYARVKLSYEFYNGETKLETLPASFKASDLITTSATFFGSDWVDSGAGDGYYYYATGTTLNKFVSGGEYIDLFDTNARFIIEGAGFTGAENEGEGGGFVVDETTSINKIVVYLTLETLQGDADATAEGWKIEKPVVFADATEKLETSVGKVATTENLNVSVGGAAEVPLNKVVFPYDTTTTLTFDSNNVEYVTLTYSNGESETFSETAANTYEVYAHSTKGTVTAYTVGLWSDSEYTGFTYSSKGFNQDMSQYDIKNGIGITGYYGIENKLNIQPIVKVRIRDFKIELEYSSYEEFENAFWTILGSLQYPAKIGNNKFENITDVYAWMHSINKSTFMSDYSSPMIITYETYCDASSSIGTNKTITEIGVGAFYGKNITNISLSSEITKINFYAMQDCIELTSITITESLKEIGNGAFSGCTNLETTIGSGWVKVEDGSAVDSSTLLKDISYDIRRNA